MKDLKYLFTILYIQNTVCTIDIGVSEYVYLSKHLTPQECRRLYTSLYFTSYDFPASHIVEKNIPHASCIDLLLKWDRGKHKGEGKGRSHVDVERRLRQIGKPDLAQWLDRKVYLKLQNETLQALDIPFREKPNPKSKDYRRTLEDWTFSTVVFVVLGAVISAVIYIALRVIVTCLLRRFLLRKGKQDDTVELLNYDDVDSDQETMYECVVNKNIRRDASRDKDDV